MERINQAKLFVGSDKWHTYAIEEESIPSLTMADGPNGLRIEKKNLIGFSESKEAVAYPTASCIACSFDRDLLYELGSALANECLQEGIDILLGPGVNHKRSPLCGRNFEYYSEDPILSSELAIEYIHGLQDHGVGSSLKHFAGNSRELSRMREDSIIDERALQEIYLRQFERIVKHAKPWTIMAAYNRLNGTYCTENRFLLNDLLRKQWNYDGVVVSDWGAVSNPIQAILNGCNLEMPGGDHGTSQMLVEESKHNKELEKAIEENTKTIQRLVERCSNKQETSYSIEDHLNFAQELAERSAVLLKNDSVLPFTKQESILVVGALAKHPRYQGTGSSKVNAISVDSILEAMEEENGQVHYAQGYHRSIEETDPILLEQALLMAPSYDKVLVVVGLPEGKEAEGMDRKDLALPKCQNELIERLTAIHNQVIVVVQCGSPIEMPWAAKIQGLFMMYLSGCRGGHACVNLLYGKVNPSGKLAETFPLELKDTPSYLYYHDSLYNCLYRESFFTGYRYYQSFSKGVLFPFGKGYSYTSFSYRDFSVEEKEEEIHVHFFLKNVGERTGREISQIYVSLPNSKIVRPKKELKTFSNIELQPQEEKEINLIIPKEDLTYYDTKQKNYVLEEGEYLIELGQSSEDIISTQHLFLTGEKEPYSSIQKKYFALEDGVLTVTKEDFENMLGHTLELEKAKQSFTRDSMIYELHEHRFGRFVHKRIQKYLKKNPMPDVSISMVMETPLRSILQAGEKVTWKTVDAIVYLFNGHFFKGTHRAIRSLK